MYAVWASCMFVECVLCAFFKSLAMRFLKLMYLGISGMVSVKLVLPVHQAYLESNIGKAGNTMMCVHRSYYRGFSIHIGAITP